MEWSCRDVEITLAAVVQAHVLDQDQDENVEQIRADVDE